MQLQLKRKQAFAYLLDGPRGLPRSLQLEWRFVLVRWIGIGFMAVGLPLASLPQQQMLGAYAVLAFAFVYNLVIQLTICRYADVYAAGYITSVGDAILNVGMLTLAGGFDTPLYYILFTVTISAAMRYGYRPAVAMAGMFILFDLLERLVGGHGISGTYFFRSGFLFITAILAGYLREQARRAQDALQQRLHQANLLNESTEKLGADLELERVLNAVCEAAAVLFGASLAVLTPPRTDYGSGDLSLLPEPAYYPQLEGSGEQRWLLNLCNSYASSNSENHAEQQLLHTAVTPSGNRALVLQLSTPNRQVPPSVLALTLPPGQIEANIDQDVMHSFAERITLAIENSSLYRTLANRSYALQRAYADLAQAHEELLRLDELKSSFLANVSHELRTPLSSIRSFSEMLLSYDNSPEVEKEFLGIIVSESERLTRLVSDVLDLAKIDSGNVEWQEELFDLSALLCETGSAYGVLVEKQGLKFEQEIIAGIPPVTGDADRIQQVVRNLLDNAIKFTTVGTIRLSARIVGEEIFVSVQDSGIGIAEEDQARIFEKFQQVGAVLTDKPHGTGLGLAICKEIIQHHNGRIWVESEAGEGSTFTFSLRSETETVRSSGASRAGLFTSSLTRAQQAPAVA